MGRGVHVERERERGKMENSEFGFLVVFLV